jgi:hypothetical protein
MQFKKMPQGFKNSPAIFQRAMSLILKNLIGKICLVYIDDILVFGKTKEDHDLNFEIISKTLKEYNLTENKQKRIFREENVLFLGYEISYNTIKPNTSHKQGIMEYKTPKNKKELQRFLGFINYDRMFVKNMTEKIKPLYVLLEKDKKFFWGDVENETFNKIKLEWGNHLELTLPNMNDVFELEADASNVGLGAVLRQNNKPIAYISRSLSPSEKNYTITEKEVLAALWAMEKLNFYLFGKEFVLVTDHKAIEELKQKVDFGTPRITRWFERIEKYQFKIRYKKGEEILAADALSRAPPPSNMKENEKIDDIEYKILKEHENLSHRKTIKNNLKQKEIEISNKKLKAILDKCEICKRKDKIISKSCIYIKVDKPGEKIGMDIMEFDENNSVITAIDYFSRKSFAKCVNTKEARKVVKFLNEIYEQFKFEGLITDNGREFQNKMVSQWCVDKGVKQTFSVPFYHQSNGRIERLNRTIRNGLKKSRGCIKVMLQKVIKNYYKYISQGPRNEPK